VSAALHDFWLALSQSGLGLWIAGSTWVYPLLEIVHVVGLGLLFGPIVLLDLRILGIGRELPLGALGRTVLPCVWTGFFLNATSGVLLFVSNAAELAANTPFRIKIVLIALAGLNVLVLHRRTYARAVSLATGARAPNAARAAATASICLWLGVIAAGRMIAYID